MAGAQDYWEFFDDFIGAGTFVTSAGLDPWVITDASSAGTPTYTRLDLGETAGVFRPGVAQLAFDSQTEAQNICLSFGDKLAFDINSVRGFETSLRFVAQTGSAKDSNTTFAWGLTGDRADAIDSIAVASIFRLAAATASNAIVIENDDTVNTNDDVATGLSLTDTVWCNFKIDLSDLNDVKYYAGIGSAGLQRVGAGTSMKMSSYSAGLQPFFQLQKASDNNTDAVQIDYVRVWGVRL
jgi:hypothetical protein